MDHSGITRVAEAMVAFLGSRAISEARQKASEALDRGQEDEFRAWHRIMKAAQSVLRSNS
jgi:hypothetical protein